MTAEAELHDRATQLLGEHGLVAGVAASFRIGLVRNILGWLGAVTPSRCRLCHRIGGGCLGHGLACIQRGDAIEEHAQPLVTALGGTGRQADERKHSQQGTRPAGRPLAAARHVSTLCPLMRGSPPCHWSPIGAHSSTTAPSPASGASGSPSALGTASGVMCPYPKTETFWRPYWLTTRSRYSSSNPGAAYCLKTSTLS